jgi:glycerol-3-phosphate dehydrogenase
MKSNKSEEIHFLFWEDVFLMNNITVIGCGRWGSFIAYYLDKIGKNVTLYGSINIPSNNNIPTQITESVIQADKVYGAVWG